MFEIQVYENMMVQWNSYVSKSHEQAIHFDLSVHPDICL